MAAYDIADPRRLCRVHRFLKKQGIGVQKSVFLVRKTEKQMNVLMDRIAELMNLREDDLRAYPIRHPSAIWICGVHPLDRFPLVRPGASEKPGRKKAPGRSFWQRLLKPFERRG